MEISESPSGRVIVDFGQNLVGRLRIGVTGERGSEITLRHAEVLQDGELCTRPLRGAAATDRYVLRGEGRETWEPRFTFHGFRYAEVTGDVRPDEIVARVCHTDLRRTGRFACSDELLNRLHDNVVWSMRGNFLDVPTDCPQRDERLGWTGDLQVFAPTAAFLHDVRGFLVSWLRDLAADQFDDERGIPPVASPDIPLRLPEGAPEGRMPMTGWGDATVIVPWVLHERYGDRGVLAEQYPSMRAWIDAVDEIAGPGRIWRQPFQFGDWLDPNAPPENPGQAMTSPELVATAYFAHSTRLLARTAGLLGRTADAERYGTLAEEVRRAFCDEFRTGPGTLSERTQAAYALALHFDLLDAEERDIAGAHLAELVRAGGHRIGTGFLGTPVICDALTSTGHLDTAYELLQQRESPSWLHPVTMGATTVWERWDSMLPDGTVNPGEMTSFNHYALGAVADWLQRTVAGLAPGSPGYRRLRIAPRPGGGLTWAHAALDTPYGHAEVGWTRDGDQLTVTVEIPPGTRAVVDLPGSSPYEIGSGRHETTTSI
ncbi:family 78 glycoside hydrolase catalytic domain [Saccharopolyspora sp. S2-29]|uniref:alpha-L-rhamnosidase n=1 Tax=Saccharopolyspora mangrovi TaxID=3082379 RepID=A0ABU6A6Y7_9PSEU|nr:family 78 glycoside hydrolase catalytic domain [Saccharopolyspora sp. S2-29]MEB3367250.1 family 78 glycoside hydrolase catalytic domain [Saccharopolyspora sp. S2-29]